MGFFGFGKNKKSDMNEDAVSENSINTEELNDSEVSAERGPWDIEDPLVPDYDEYMNAGALYLPLMDNIQLRLKALPPEGHIVSAMITRGSSSLEVEVFAAPKKSGIWDDIRTEFLKNRVKAYETDGVFGKEIKLPVQVQGNEVMSRIVGIDGPRWMLRGIFTGLAALDDDCDEKADLENFFSSIVVNRGNEPLAPGDCIYLQQPLTPAQMRAMQEQTEDNDDHSTLELPEDPDGYAQQSQVQHTLRRGPLFSEMR